MKVGDFENTVEGFTIHRIIRDHPHYPCLILAKHSHKSSGISKLVFLRCVADEGDREALQRVNDELRLHKHLNHPGIGTLHGMAVGGGRLFVVSEYIEGWTLESILELALVLGRRLSPGFAAYVAREVADALDYAHRCQGAGRRALNIVHRAVSPINIHLRAKGGVVLTNFGSAYSDLINRIRTVPTLLRGDPAYMAPEMVARHVQHTQVKLDRRVDIFSLGLVLLELLTATHPLDPPAAGKATPLEDFPAEVVCERPGMLDVAVLAGRVLRLDVDRLGRAAGNLPPALQKILQKALQARPDKRYRTAGDMRDDLSAFLRASLPEYDGMDLREETESLFKGARRQQLVAIPGVERGVVELPRDVARTAEWEEA